MTWASSNETSFFEIVLFCLILIDGQLLYFKHTEAFNTYFSPFWKMCKQIFFAQTWIDFHGRSIILHYQHQRYIISFVNTFILR